MMHYDIYRGLTEKVVRTLSKEDRSFAKREREEQRKIVNHFCDRASADQITMDTLYLEWLYERNGSSTYFIETPELVEFLMEAKFQIDLEAMAFPARIFSVAMPSKGGLPGFLFGKLQFEKHIRDYEAWIKWADIKSEVKYDGSYGEWICCASTSHDGGACRSYVPLSVFDETLLPDWLQAHLSLGSLHAPDKIDIGNESRSLSLGARLVAYMNAFPEMVKPGLPQEAVEREVRGFRVSSVKTITMHPKLRNSPAAHLRSAHFRTLTHERYKRDANNCARVVYVRSTIVGTKMDPHTIKDVME